jgi:hypothetical protein
VTARILILRNWIAVKFSSRVFFRTSHYRLKNVLSSDWRQNLYQFSHRNIFTERRHTKPTLMDPNNIIIISHHIAHFSRLSLFEQITPQWCYQERQEQN